MSILDNVKIKYIQEGYLPNYPYHLISDIEAFNAFLQVSQQFCGDGIKSKFLLYPAVSSIYSISIDRIRLNEGTDYTCIDPYTFSISSSNINATLINRYSLDSKTQVE